MKNQTKPSSQSKTIPQSQIKTKPELESHQKEAWLQNQDHTWRQNWNRTLIPNQTWNSNKFPDRITKPEPETINLSRIRIQTKTQPEAKTELKTKLKQTSYLTCGRNFCANIVNLKR